MVVIGHQPRFNAHVQRSKLEPRTCVDAHTDIEKGVCEWKGGRDQGVAKGGKETHGHHTLGTGVVRWRW